MRLRLTMDSHIKPIEFYKGVTIVRFTGSVTFDNLPETQLEFSSRLKDKPVKNILFDLKDVPETDSTGIAALINLLKQMKAHQAGEKIALINVPQGIRDLFSISKTTPLFTEYPSEEEAIKSL